MFQFPRPLPHAVQLPPVVAVVASSDAEARAWLGQVLAAAGVDVRHLVSTASLAEALARFERADLCVLDTRLVGDAVAATEEIVTAVPSSRVVVLDRQLDKSTFLAVMGAGGAGYLLYDVDRSHLLVALRQVLAGEPAVPRELVAALVDELKDPPADG